MHRHRGSDYYEAFQDFRDGLVEKDMELVLQKQEQFDRRWLKIGLAKTREVQEAQDTLENFQSTAWKEGIELDGVMGHFIKAAHKAAIERENNMGLEEISPSVVEKWKKAAGHVYEDAVQDGGFDVSNLPALIRDHELTYLGPRQLPSACSPRSRRTRQLSKR